MTEINRMDQKVISNNVPYHELLFYDFISSFSERLQYFLELLLQKASACSAINLGLVSALF